MVYICLYEPAYEKRVLMRWETSKGSDKTAHKHSLTRAFAVRRRDLEEASGRKSMSLTQIGECACAFEEPQTSASSNCTYKIC